MIGYNPSHLNKNETLLEAFHRVEAYLKANPQYQVFQSSATYQEGTQEYALDTIVVPEGSSVGKGDVVLFSNVYYAVITAVSETTFSVTTATNFRGTTGATGANGTDGKDGVTPNISMNATVDNNVGVPEVEVTKGGTNENPSFTLGFHNIKGATGAKGETGLPALMYSKNVTTGPYSNFVTDLDGYNRTPQINDSCVYVSTNNDYLINGTIEQIFSDRQEASVHILAKIHIVGQEGPRGPQGVNGRDGKDGISTLLYAGELSESVTTAEIAQVTMPTDRVSQVYDILISTSSNTFGAMAQVTGLGEDIVNVNFIGTLITDSPLVSDYNQLDNRPVINQDLSASGFAPVVNTYYRHIGVTTDTFTPGVIYLYNGTGYAALGESGSGGGKTYELVGARVTLANNGTGGSKSYTVPSDVYSPSANFAMWLYERAIPGRWRLIITDLDTREAISLTPCYPLYDKHWYGGLNDTGTSIHQMVFSSETSYDIKTDNYTTTRLYEVSVQQNTISFYNDRLVKETYMFNKDVLTRKADQPFNKSGNISVILEYTILSEVTE